MKNNLFIVFILFLSISSTLTLKAEEIQLAKTGNPLLDEISSLYVYVPNIKEIEYWEDRGYFFDIEIDCESINGINLKGIGMAYLSWYMYAKDINPKYVSEEIMYDARNWARHVIKRGFYITEYDEDGNKTIQNYCYGDFLSDYDGVGLVYVRSGNVSRIPKIDDPFRFMPHKPDWKEAKQRKINGDSNKNSDKGIWWKVLLSFIGGVLLLWVYQKYKFCI